MKKYLTFKRSSARIAFGLTLILVLASAGLAQIKLRNALDYDGDGRTDAAILRRGATNQAWYVLRSSDNSYIALTFGLTETDFPMQNDYDGDGKTDFSVWRETDGNFYVLRTSDSGLSVVPWGWLSDLPIAGYDAH